MRGAAVCHAGHGTEQVNVRVCVELVLLRQSSARRWREMTEPFSPRSESGQLLGHTGALGEREHSDSLVKGLSPSTNKRDSLNSLKRIRVREPFEGVMRSFASIVPQGKGDRVPREAVFDLIENVSWRAKNERGNTIRLINTVQVKNLLQNKFDN